MSPLGLPQLWRARAAEIEPYAPGVAAAFQRAASELEMEWANYQNEALTLDQAESESHYSRSRLADLVRTGVIPNVGKPGAPLVRRADLPKRPGAGRSVVDADISGLVDRARLSRLEV